MHIDTAGTYTLQYTATDSCGNETIEERTVEVISYRTVLYTDGTFIINEKSSDQAANEALHGVATNVYDPLDATHNYVFSTAEIRPWHSVSRNVLAVEFGSEIKPTQMAYWFAYFTHCESVDFTNLDTSNLVSTRATFLQYGAYATGDTVFDFSSFNTSNVTNMNGMFSECYMLKSFDLSSFDTSSATDMSSMFNMCNNLTTLNISSFDTSSATTMASMFSACHALTSLDVSSFDTGDVADMRYMFNSCQALSSLDISNFDTQKVTNMRAMFSSCNALTSLTLGDLDTSLVTNMQEMFSGCTNLVTLDVSSFNTSNVTMMKEMFYRCSKMTTIYASPTFITTQVGNSTDMFGEDTRLVGGAGTVFSYSYTNKTYAKIDGGTADPGYFTARP